MARGVTRWILKAWNATARFLLQETSAGFKNPEEGEWAAPKGSRPPAFALRLASWRLELPACRDGRGIQTAGFCQSLESHLESQRGLRLHPGLCLA